MADEEEKKEGPTAPEGVLPFFFPDSGAQKYGMKTGEGIVDLIEMKTFKKQPILDEIAAMGFMCPFEPVQKEINACPLEEFLVVTDIKSTYGEMFLLYYTGEAIEAELNKAAIAEKAAAEEKARKEKEEADRIAAEEARKNAVYVDEPFLSKPYTSDTQEQTEAEIAKLSIVTDRPLIKISIGRTAKSCGLECHFGNRDHDVSGQLDTRAQKIPEFDLNRSECDVGVQAASETIEQSSQTTWNRKIHKCSQYEPNPSLTSTTTSTTTSTSTDPPPLPPLEELNEEEKEARRQQIKEERQKKHQEQKNISNMLKKMLPSVEEALLQNGTVDIFREALSQVGEDDNTVGSKMENQLKELRNFTDLEFSKNKALTCIDWHPLKKGVIGVSICKSLSFDQRVERSGLVDVAHVIIWEFAEWIKPQLVLQTPHECFTFKFNPTMPDIVCGGCFSGQAIMWNLTESMEKVNLKKSTKSEVDDDEDDGAGLVAPAAMSHIDASHRRMIADMAWLPPDSMINSKGRILAEEHLDGKSYQFMTIAGDGQALVWDIRFEDIARGNLPHIYKPKPGQFDKANKDGTFSTPPWLPLFKMNVKRLEGVGELSLCKLLTDLGNKTSSGDEIDRRSHILCSSEEGDLVFADWRAKAAGKQDTKDGDEDEGNDTPEYVQWMAKDHNRPCVALAKSPFFEDTIVSVSDWSFHIWKLDSDKPIFSSPDASTYLTGGSWSPTRPGMLMISKADGCIDVWDFTDSSYHPSATLMTTPSRITSFSFLTGKTSTTKQQLLAVGDIAGSLHVFDVPRNLFKPISNEKSIMQNFFTREIKRKDFAKKRQETRDEEFAALAASNTEEGGADEGAGEKKEDGNGQGAEEEDALLEAEEIAYKELEKKFVLALGLSSEELPEHLRGYLEEEESA